MEIVRRKCKKCGIMFDTDYKEDVLCGICFYKEEDSKEVDNGEMTNDEYAEYMSHSDADSGL
jgi:ribosomal protein S27AE